tara:strand:- start:378 stop:536 length:159 start_codon:yes stop_codon:yes gene_type:complete
MIEKLLSTSLFVSFALFLILAPPLLAGAEVNPSCMMCVEYDGSGPFKIRQKQ